MKDSPEHAVSKQLARITELLEDTLILQASLARIKNGSVRAIAKVGTDRVNRVSKHIKAPKNAAHVGE